MKRCKDCKWHRVGDSKGEPYFWCVKQNKNRFAKATDCKPEDCAYYHRKWYKLWRPK